MAAVRERVLLTPFLPADLKHEEACRLAGYRDGKGIPTAGVGHTGPDARVGQR